MNRLALLFVLIAASALPVSSRSAPRFEVVSIKALPPDAPMVMRNMDFTPIRPGGGYVDTNSNIISLITFAYGVTYPDSRLLGLPEWKGSRYAVSAKAGDSFPNLAPERIASRCV